MTNAYSLTNEHFLSSFASNRIYLASLSHLITVVLRSRSTFRCFSVRFRNSLHILNVTHDGSFCYCWSKQLIITFKREQKFWTVDWSFTNNKQLCNSWPVRHLTDLSRHPIPPTTTHHSFAINIQGVHKISFPF